MNTTFRVARMSLHRCCRFVGHKARSNEASGLRRLPAASGQKRRFADRYTFDDKTQAQIEGFRNDMSMAELPRESPWREESSADFPERLDELGYESHCNDRLYMAKNKFRDAQDQYIMEREERRTEAQKRIQNHFSRNQQEPETMRRRAIQQDPVEHQKRQEQIIEQNRRKWQSRPASRRETNNSGITYRPELRREKYFEEKQQRETAKRNPGSAEDASEGETMVYDSNRPTAEWLRKREAANEAEYWHSWHTCPSSRDAETTEEVKPHLRRKKVVSHPPAYPRDGQRRGYHQIVPPVYRLKAKTAVLLHKRRPNGIEKQFHKFARKQATPWHQDVPQTSAQPQQKPQVVPKKKEDEKKPKRKEDRRSVEPPRFRMVVKSRTPVSRPSTPVCNYSGQFDMPPTIAGPSVYMAALRKSLAETCRNYSSGNTN
ncbi:uncharacterized protein LOC108144594 [Drosophila elegans]|uniref:uncharacterized protein LOC108144594 n=1 Tax=Drosophila elegans TaxID=30023 RepID=UPI0007E7804A|nr:uncharacterized protein LOC108144594 [Drosophila elegans]